MLLCIRMRIQPPPVAPIDEDKLSPLSLHGGSVKRDKQADRQTKKAAGIVLTGLPGRGPDSII